MRAPDLRPALALVAAAFMLSGCEIIDHGNNIVNGKALFIEHCGACHALERASAAGSVGPDLDAAFRRARADGQGGDTIAASSSSRSSTPGPGAGCRPGS